MIPVTLVVETKFSKSVRKQSLASGKYFGVNLITSVKSYQWEEQQLTRSESS